MKINKLFFLLCALCVLCGQSKAQQVQETPSVLLPEKYLENVREPLAVGSKAPDFTLPRCEYDKTSTSKTLQLSDWQKTKNNNGSVVIFWAFWCDTWKDVIRDMNIIRPQLEEMNLQVLSVAVDASQQPVARRDFESGRIWWPVAIDTQSEVSAEWGVRRVPTVFVLNRDREIQKVFEGFPGRQTFVRETAKALDLKVPQKKRPKK